MNALNNCAALSVDPFAAESRSDPYLLYQQLRDAAAVVRLTKYGVYGFARHEQVHAALNDHKTYCSSAGVGINNIRKDPPWRPPGPLLEADPPLHTRARSVVTSVLSRRGLNSLREPFALEAESLVERVVARGQFDAVREIAQAYPLKVFPDALGIGPEERENLLRYGNLVFNNFGPRNELLEESLRHAEELTAWITARTARAALRPGGLGAQIYEAADAGQVSEEEARLLVRSFLTAGVDTTVNALGNALVCLARNPGQWQLLHENPSLARGAFEEAIRHESPVQTFFRTTTTAVTVAGAQIAEGEKVLLFLGAANRDPRRWKDPQRLDILRNTTGHVGFGWGIHACVGQMVARLEGELILSALARRVRSITLKGEPVPRFNNTLRGWDSLPVEVELA